MDNFSKITCCECGIEFAVATYWRNKLIETHDNFYCPSGHILAFNGETSADKLKKQLDSQKSRTERAEGSLRYYKNSRNSYKGHLTRLKEKLK